jgi:hypothetical protein
VGAKKEAISGCPLKYTFFSFSYLTLDKPNNCFMNKQRIFYTLEGLDEECEWIYVVNFFQNVLQKVKHPLFSRENLNGSHETSIFGNADQIICANG